MRDFVFGLVGGAALIMFGVETMGAALEAAAGPGVRRVLRALTGTVGRAFAAGAALTALVQSSTAVTVLTVGLVDAGLMRLAQAVGVIYGANLGTTATAQLMAFQVTDYALPMVAFGFALRLAGGRGRGAARVARRGAAVGPAPLAVFGGALLGMGLVFLGLQVLHAGIPFVRDSEVTRRAFVALAAHPIGAVLAGMAVTMLVHSSSATVGLAIVLARAGLLDLTAAVALMLGDNIGTCVTAQVAAIGRSAGARRAAWAHTLFNVATVLLAMVVLPVAVGAVRGTSGEVGRQIANAHTLFNVAGAALFLPLTGAFVQLLEWLVPE